MKAALLYLECAHCHCEFAPSPTQIKRRDTTESARFYCSGICQRAGGRGSRGVDDPGAACGDREEGGSGAVEEQVGRLIPGLHLRLDLTEHFVFKPAVRREAPPLKVFARCLFSKSIENEREA
jgi:hypothetical protein